MKRNATSVVPAPIRKHIIPRLFAPSENEDPADRPIHDTNRAVPSDERSVKDSAASPVPLPNADIAAPMITDTISTPEEPGVIPPMRTFPKRYPAATAVKNRITTDEAFIRTTFR